MLVPFLTPLSFLGLDKITSRNTTLNMEQQVLIKKQIYLITIFFSPFFFPVRLT